MAIIIPDQILDMKYGRIYKYFIIVKTLVLLILVSIKKQSTDSIVYVISDTLLKFSIGMYLIVFFSTHDIPNLAFEDSLLFRLIGVVLILDINYSRLIKTIRKIYAPLPKIPILEDHAGLLSNA